MEAEEHEYGQLFPPRNTGSDGRGKRDAEWHTSAEFRRHGQRPGSMEAPPYRKMRRPGWWTNYLH